MAIKKFDKGILGILQKHFHELNKDGQLDVEINKAALEIHEQSSYMNQQYEFYKKLKNKLATLLVTNTEDNETLQIYYNEIEEKVRLYDKELKDKKKAQAKAH